jgi:hypothetical protein
MISKALTLGQIKNSLETKIFTFKNPSELESKYLQRETSIKQTIDFCIGQIMDLGQSPGLDKLTKRQRIKSKNCVENLSKYIKELISELERNTIINHFEKIENGKNRFVPGGNQIFEVDYTFLMSNSFHTAITTEILWAPRVTVKQAIEISRGTLDLNDLGRHLPELIKEIKNDILPYLKQSDINKDFYESIKEAIDCFSKKHYRGCNLILIITIEGMVRKLSNYLSSFHELGPDFSDQQFLSFNSLLRNVKWKKDFQIDTSTFQLLIGQSSTLKERRKNIQNYADDFQIIDLNTRLDFLKGRFKDDRDLILHGSSIDYNKEWNLFLNFSALVETKEVCLYYEKKYGS